jgi:hypothetical protein
MRTPSETFLPNVPLLPAALALSAFALAACGTVGAATGPAARVAGTSPAGQSRGAVSPEQQARNDAAAMLAAFVPPPGATRLSKPPGGVGGKLSHPEGYPSDPDVVYAATLWQIPGMTPKQVLAWEKAHLPSRFKLSLQTGEEVTVPPRFRPPGDPYHYASYGFSPPAGKTDFGEMTVGAASTLAGQTYVRVQAVVAWQPPRPATEKVPAAAKVITITAQPDLNAPHDVPGPVTITDPVKVSRVISLLDGLNIDPGGMHGCLMMSGRGITLTFRASASGPALATAHEDVPDCGRVAFAIGGHGQPALSDWGSFASKALGIAGVRWRGWNVPAR